MKCYRCGGFLYENDYCADCGADVSTYKRIVKKSNELYNRALKLARDRNLSGAIDNLQVSLKMYKANVNARNLLGLIYVEMGEYALGLAQWVISTSIQPENNIAQRYMEELQTNRQDLNMMNTSIRKYNKAVKYVQQGNYDIAEIQLKKLLNENVNLVKGYQLLVLLLIRKKKYVEARNILKRAEQIDAGNPTTVAYQTAVKEKIAEAEEALNPTELRNKRVAEAGQEERNPLSGDDVIIPKSSYKEYNPTTMAVIQIIIGAVIGAAIIFFIVLPAKTKSLRSEYSTQIADLQTQVEELQHASSGEGEGEEETNVPEEPAAGDFQNIVNAQLAFDKGDFTAAYEAIGKVDTANLNDDQRAYFDTLRSKVTESVYGNTMNEGISFYTGEKYGEALAKFKSLYDQGVHTADLLYYLGRTYDFLEDKENTLKYLRQYVAEYPDDGNITIANQIINSWNN